MPCLYHPQRLLEMPSIASLTSLSCPYISSIFYDSPIRFCKLIYSSIFPFFILFFPCWLYCSYFFLSLRMLVISSHSSLCVPRLRFVTLVSSDCLTARCSLVSCLSVHAVRCYFSSELVLCYLLCARYFHWPRFLVLPLTLLFYAYIPISLCFRSETYISRLSSDLHAFWLATSSSRLV